MLVYWHSDRVISNGICTIYTCRNIYISQLLITFKQHQTTMLACILSISMQYLIDHVIILPYCKTFSTHYEN